MRKTLVLAAASLIAAALPAPLSAQMGGRGAPPPDEGFPRPSERRPRPPKPIKRERLDRIVHAMFAQADTNRDGMVTLAELQAIGDARRAEAARKLFATIDKDGNGVLSQAEFLAWQQMPSAAVRPGDRPDAASDRRRSEAIVPEVDEDSDDARLIDLIDPLDALVIVAANTNYDAGVTLDELLAYERRKFDAADTDRDGELSVQELRALAPHDGSPGGRGGPGGWGGPPDNGRGDRDESKSRPRKPIDIGGDD